MALTAMSVTVYLSSGQTVTVAGVLSINVAANVLFLYDGSDNILAGFASGVWQRFTKTATA